MRWKTTHIKLHGARAGAAVSFGVGVHYFKVLLVSEVCTAKGNWEHNIETWQGKTPHTKLQQAAKPPRW